MTRQYQWFPLLAIAAGCLVGNALSRNTCVAMEPKREHTAESVGEKASVPGSPERSAVYVEAGGRSFFLYSLHWEVALSRLLAVDLGFSALYLPRAFTMVFGSAGVAYWPWSSGPSSIVLSVSLGAHGAKGEWGDSFCCPSEPGVVSCECHFDWGVGVAVGAFYEFRSSVLLRIGVTPQVMLWSQSPFLWYQLGGSADWQEYFQLVALQVGWSL